MMAEAERRKADLIVTGGYGHLRLREWLLGGVTYNACGSRECVVGRAACAGDLAGDLRSDTCDLNTKPTVARPGCRHIKIKPVSAITAIRIF